MLTVWNSEHNQEIARLEQICFDDPWSLSMIEETASADNFYGVVDVEDGKTVGYAGAVFAQDVADIALVAVSPEYTRRGIAFSMMNELCARLIGMGINEIFLEVRVSNHAAIGLYAKCGFVSVGLRKKYYENGEDAIVMIKRKAD